MVPITARTSDQSMLFARLQLRAPEARSILVAAANDRDLASSISANLASTADEVGQRSRLVRVIEDDAPPPAGFPGEALTVARLGSVNEARDLLATFDGTTVICGQGILSSPTTLLLASVADATLIVAKRRKTSRAQLAAARLELERAGARLVGAVLED